MCNIPVYCLLGHSLTLTLPCDGVSVVSETVRLREDNMSSFVNTFSGLLSQPPTVDV